jgi:hypothetical protein
MVRAELLAAPVAVKLTAAGAKHFAAAGIGARADFQDGIAALFVILDR